MLARTHTTSVRRRKKGHDQRTQHKRDIIVIGASAGGVESVCKVLEKLPAGFDATVFVVVHVGETSILPQILSRCGHLPVAHPQDAEMIHRGRVYVAPPNHHLQIEDGRMRVDKGPRENRHRPSVDKLFRSAARSYRSRVIAVILSGALDDGVSGAFVVKERGGVVIVQDPNQARVPDMPRNTLRGVKVDHCRPVEAIAPLLVKLVRNPSPNGKGCEPCSNGKISTAPVPEKKLVPLVCPECLGPIHFEADDKRFKCEVGHAYSLGALSAAHSETLERILWAAIRTLRERTTLHEYLAHNQEIQNNPRMAERFRETAQSAEKDAILLREVLDHLE